MIVIGLTGSIGMGKSTCADMFETLGIPSHNADTSVHELLSTEGPALQAIRTEFPYYDYEKIYGKKTKAGVREIKRKELGEIVFHDDAERKKLENILHPLVRQSQTEFIKKHKSLGIDMVVLDIPLLFETDGNNFVDVTVVATAPTHIQRERVLSRPEMTEERFQAIIEKQMPDGEKQARADYILHTGLGRAQTMKEIKALVKELRTAKIKA